MRILMCPPDYFSVDYVINPWMAGHEGSPDIELAKEQWETLRGELAEYADIVIMEPQPDLPDLVFTANAGVVYGNKAIASHFMPKERRPEEPHLKKWFRENGYDLLELDEKIGFEGAGDCLFDRGGPWLWTGYGFRTEIEAHAQIQKFFDVELVSIHLTDSRFYHIDTCFCPLSGGFLMYHPPAFDFDSRMAIESRIPSHKRIVVDTADAGNLRPRTRRWRSSGSRARRCGRWLRGCSRPRTIPRLRRSSSSTKAGRSAWLSLKSFDRPSITCGRRGEMSTSTPIR
jgi:N-dimethylarginine dimethylaminohydrolase